MPWSWFNILQLCKIKTNRHFKTNLHFRSIGELRPLSLQPSGSIAFLRPKKLPVFLVKMNNELVALTAFLLTGGFFLFALTCYLREDADSSKKSMKRKRCEYCSRMNGFHDYKCPFEPPKPTDYYVYTYEIRTEHCTVCMEDFTNGSIVARLPCFCLYHKRCIDRWFLQNPQCPIHRDWTGTDEVSSGTDE